MKKLGGTTNSLSFAFARLMIPVFKPLVDLNAGASETGLNSSALIPDGNHYGLCGEPMAKQALTLRAFVLLDNKVCSLTSDFQYIEW